MPHIEVNSDSPLQTQLGCLGYYGFGGGFAMARFGTSNDDRGVYCNRCPDNKNCWQLHRIRVQQAMPELAKLSDEIGARHSGKYFAREWLRRTRQNGENFVEPYSTMMMGNMQDGASMAELGTMQDHGPHTLTWPLTPIAPKGGSGGS